MSFYFNFCDTYLHHYWFRGWIYALWRRIHWPWLKVRLPHSWILIRSAFHAAFTSCEDINECSVHPEICPDNMYCKNNQGSYSCGCYDGFKPADDGPSCVDVNECLEGFGFSEASRKSGSEKPKKGGHTCDSSSQLCENTFGGHKCINDNDECSKNLHDCDQNAKCTNNLPGFSCSCDPGKFHQFFESYFLKSFWSQERLFWQWPVLSWFEVW